MNKFVCCLLFSGSFLLTSWVFAQNSGSGVFVSGAIQGHGSIQDNSEKNAGNAANKANSSQNTKNTTKGAKSKRRVPANGAINACRSKSKGDACEVTTSYGLRAGVCVYTSDKRYLFCRHNRK